jgi:uncharacterized RDD family membrane protein YckC
MQTADIFKVPGLGFKKKDQRDPKYATFNRRMIAATIDSFLIMLFIAPVIDWIFLHFYGPVPVDWTGLQKKMNDAQDERAANELFWRTLSESGFILRWWVNSIWQFIVLAAATGYCWRRWSATPGKMAMGIKVADATTEAPISDRQIIIRLFGYVVSSVVLLMGFFWIGFDKRRQAWHDKLANTVVIRVSKAKPELPAADPSDSPAPSKAE